MFVHTRIHKLGRATGADASMKQKARVWLLHVATNSNCTLLCRRNIT